MTSESIVVEYYPAGEPSPFPDPSVTEWQFKTHDEFKRWVQGYVCIHCLIDFFEFTGKEPETLHDWLHMGCGCEIGVTDDSNLIDWDDKMVKSDDYHKALDDYKQMMADAFDRHG